MGRNLCGLNMEINDPLDEPPPPIPIYDRDTVQQMYSHKSPKEDENIIIINSAADISCIGHGFTVVFHSGETTTVHTALANSNGNDFDIVTAAAVVEDPTSS